MAWSWHRSGHYRALFVNPVYPRTVVTPALSAVRREPEIAAGAAAIGLFHGARVGGAKFLLLVSMLALACRAVQLSVHQLDAELKWGLI